MTPLMKQYWDIKNQHPDKILLFRMGDFYEMFYDDAVKAAPLLNIALTARNKSQGIDVPMCGVPHHSVGPQINKLLKAGLKVAICDQIENPQNMEGKIVKRAVTRVVTPGMVYDPENLDANSQNYVAALVERVNQFYDLSLIDASTGEFLNSKNISAAQVILTIQKYNPKEILLPTGYKLFFDPKTLTSFKPLDKGISASQFLTEYLKETQGEEVLKTLRIESEISQTSMFLSPTTLRHLEIFKKYDEEDKNTLFEVLNLNATPMGARLLKKRLLEPFVDKNKIQEQHSKIEELLKDQIKLSELKAELSKIGDLERKIVKLSNPLCNARDIKALSNSLLSVRACFGSKEKLISKINFISEEVNNTLRDEPPHSVKEGGMIKKGVSKILDEYIDLSTGAQEKLTQLEEKERLNSKINSLKIKYNNIFGYSFEITKANLDKVPKHFVRRQTLAQAERFVTEELSDLEQKILSAIQKRSDLEFEIFNQLRLKILSQALDLLNISDEVAKLDLSVCFATLALQRNYIKPEFNLNQSIELKKSRHAVIEVLADFIPNDISLQKGECLLLTGPNMAGKSTIMRQVALTAIVAQIGCFVSASEAKLPIFDKIFTRIGANDNLSQGQSTFMVEMTETAQIVREATENSLIILDEIGRGTSTYDGLSLAHAILEYFVSHVKAYTFFATHYHELTDISLTQVMVKNAHMSIEEHKDELIFLRKLTSGPANRSYGIEVAKLAGLPSSITTQALKILKDLTIKSQSINSKQMAFDLSDKFNQVKLGDDVDEIKTKAQKLEGLIKEINQFDVNSMTPLEAMNYLSLVKSKISKHELH
ncbi:MAG: DNA mismatch repair protein MutS [Oligoflexia bacterium]|nr:DNA mismatch repair protein MutS [Oligoflexia bacterium]